jgi:predicted RNA-binding protein Jag
MSTVYEVVARNAEQAKQKAAIRYGIPAETLHVSAEYEPDEQDMAMLAQEEAATPALASAEGTPTLYHLRQESSAFIDYARTLTQRLVDCIHEGAKVDATLFGHAILIRIHTADASLLIGREGATLNALQHLVVRCCVAKDENFPDVLLDVGGYRESRLLRLGEMAMRSAHKVLETKRPISLPPMSPLERKYIHNMLKDLPGILTGSEGEEPERHIVLKAADAPSGPAPSAAAAPAGAEGSDEGEKGTAPAAGTTPQEAKPTGRLGRRKRRRGQGGSTPEPPRPPQPPQQQQQQRQHHGGGGHQQRHQGGGQNRHQQHGGGHSRNRHGGHQQRRFEQGQPQPPAPPGWNQGAPAGGYPEGEEPGDDIGNRIDYRPQQGNRGGQNRGGQYRGGGNWNRGGGQRRGQYGSQKIDYAGLPRITPEEEEAAYREAARMRDQIEETRSRLPEYRPPAPQAPSGDGRMVDELE